MTIFLALLLLAQIPSQQTLAPHPLYFTKTGERTKISLEVDGEWFDVSWDGGSLDLKLSKDQNKFVRTFKNVKREYYKAIDQAVGIHFLAYISAIIFGGGTWAIILTPLFLSWKTWAITSSAIVASMVIYSTWCLHHSKKKEK